MICCLLLRSTEIDTASRNIDTNVRRSVYRDISEEKLFDLASACKLVSNAHVDATVNQQLNPT